MSNPRRPPSTFRLYPVISTLLLLVVTLLGRPASAAPSRMDCANVAITAPMQGAAVSGAAEIRGQALVSNFQFYKVEYSPLEREQWVLIGLDVVRTPVQNGLLVTWQTAMVREGEYRVRLRAVDVTGNYCETVVSRVDVRRAQPTETAPEPTETAALTVVPPQPSLTPMLKPTLEVAPILSQPGAIPTRVQTLPLPDLNPSGLATFFVSGVLITVALTLSVGLVVFVRRWR